MALREDLYDAVTRGARQLLGADACQIWRLDPEAYELVLAATDPPDAPEVEPAASTGPRCMLDLMRRAGGDRAAAVVRGVEEDERLLVAPLAAGDEQLGILCCLVRGRGFGDEDAELLRAVANQTAVGLKKAELIERLTAENIVKDMFEALAAGSSGRGRGQGRARPGATSRRPHVFVHAERAPAQDPTALPGPSSPARVQTRLRRAVPARASSTPATTACGRSCPLAAARPRRRRAARDVRATTWRVSYGLLIGLTEPDRGAAGARRRMREAADAARIVRSLAGGGGAISYDQLGAYRYLVHLELDEAPQRPLRAGGGGAAGVRRAAQRPAGGDARDLPGAALERRGERPGSLHPPQHGAPAPRPHRADHRGSTLRAADLLSLELALKVARLHTVREP